MSVDGLNISQVLSEKLRAIGVGNTPSAPAPATGGGFSAARELFKNNYETDAIMLFGGVAGSSYNSSKKFSAIAGDLDFRFRPMPGGSVYSAQVGQYPFANQSIAANAIIQQPVRISMFGVCPASPETVGYLSKNGAFTSLVSTLVQHSNLGGVFGVWTPAYTYTNCLLLDVVDATDGQSNQAQYQWRFDFLQPLVTLEQAQKALNSLMQHLTAGTPTIPTWSGVQNGNPARFQTTATGGLIAPSMVS